MRKTALISLDALSDTEFERLKKLKNFKLFLQNGVHCKNSISVYPTQTYTVHTSVITGNYPNKHGIYNNHYFQPFIENKNKEWFWYRHQVKSETLYDKVRKDKGRVCSILWPVTGKSKIKYNIPEIVAINNENQGIKVIKNSSFLFTLRADIKYGKMRDGIAQPQLDEFAKTCAIDCIKRHTPDLVMVHLVSVDSAKHYNGVESEKVDEALVHLDKMIGEIMDACGDDYTIILFSDHGQFTVKKQVHLNVFLQQHGLVDFEKKTFDAYIQYMGGSCILRAKNKEFMQKAVKLFKKNKDMLGIEDIYGRQMLDKFRISKDIEYIIEGKAGYYFKEENHKSVIKDFEAENISYATHGYSPLKDDYKCLFFAKGEGIKSGFKIENMNVIDIAPTVAKIMGIKDFECDGRVLKEIFK